MWTRSISFLDRPGEHQQNLIKCRYKRDANRTRRARILSSLGAKRRGFLQEFDLLRFIIIILYTERFAEHDICP